MVVTLRSDIHWFEIPVMTKSQKIIPLATAPRDASNASDSVLSQAAVFSSNASSSVLPAIAKRTRELEDALHERDMVVQMLTQRLEQAADQLDRMQRTGTDRRGTSLAGIPPELMEGQQTLLDQMNRMLGEWEEIQAGPMLNRIESQIAELKDLVSAGPSVSRSENTRSTDGGRPKTDAASSVIKPALRRVEDLVAAKSSDWEVIKAAMLANEELNSPPPVQTTESSTTASASSPGIHGTSESLSESVLDDLPPQLPETPAYVDVDQVGIEDLREAVQLRDDYISMLTRRVVAQDQATRFPDWDALSHVPSELRYELENLRQQLQQKLKIAEIDLSLQRARLAREDSKLQTKAEHVARQMRQMGLSTDDASPAATATPNRIADGQQGRRWLQFLQRSTAVSNNPTAGS